LCSVASRSCAEFGRFLICWLLVQHFTKNLPLVTNATTLGGSLVGGQAGGASAKAGLQQGPI